MSNTEEEKTQLILEYRAMEKRIREIHKEFYDWCAVCRDPKNHKFSSQYPCPTIKALDGEQ